MKPSAAIKTTSSSSTASCILAEVGPLAISIFPVCSGVFPGVNSANRPNPSLTRTISLVGDRGPIFGHKIKSSPASPFNPKSESWYVCWNIPLAVLYECRASPLRIYRILFERTKSPI